MKILFAILLAIAAASFRLLPHPANFAPIGALALFLGARLSRKQSIPIVLGAMLASDWIIGFYDWRLMLVVYGSFATAIIFGSWVGTNFKWQKFILGTAAGSLFFFLSTNLAVWAFSPWYPHTLAGLLACYIAAVPFFRNTFISDFVFGGAFFGAYEWIRSRSPSWAYNVAVVHAAFEGPVRGKINS
jgi:hypothetical protein